MNKTPPMLSRRTWLMGVGAAAALAISHPLAAQDDAPAAPAADAMELVLLLHPSVPSEDLKRSLVSSIYHGRRASWARGIPALPVLRPITSPMTEALLESTLSTTRSAFEGQWQTNELSGQGVRPTEISAIEDVIERVRSQEGAVCYAFRGELPDPLPEGVVIVPAPMKGGR